MSAHLFQASTARIAGQPPALTSSKRCVVSPAKVSGAIVLSLRCALLLLMVSEASRLDRASVKVEGREELLTVVLKVCLPVKLRVGYGGSFGRRVYQLRSWKFGPK